MVENRREKLNRLLVVIDYLKSVGLIKNQTDLAKKVQLQKCTVSNILNARSKLSIDFITKLLKGYPYDKDLIDYVVYGVCSNPALIDLLNKPFSVRYLGRLDEIPDSLIDFERTIYRDDCPRMSIYLPKLKYAEVSFEINDKYYFFRAWRNTFLDEKRYYLFVLRDGNRLFSETKKAFYDERDGKYQLVDTQGRPMSFPRSDVAYIYEAIGYIFIYPTI